MTSVMLRAEDKKVLKPFVALAKQQGLYVAYIRGKRPQTAIRQTDYMLNSEETNRQVKILSVKKLQKTPEERGFGCMKGKIWMADDFDAPLDDFAEYM